MCFDWLSGLVSGNIVDTHIQPKPATGDEAFPREIRKSHGRGGDGGDVGSILVFRNGPRCSSFTEQKKTREIFVLPGVHDIRC